MIVINIWEETFVALLHRRGPVIDNIATNTFSNTVDININFKMSDKTVKTVKDIEEYLGLERTVVPTMVAYREAYKKHFHLHPDKNLDNTKETTEAFQKVTAP